MSGEGMPGATQPSKKVYEAKGTHVLADLKGADPLKLADGQWLQSIACEAAQFAGATVLFAHTHGFGQGQGVAGVVLLAESHLTFHTWPEHGAASLDAFMCGECEPLRALALMATKLGAATVDWRIIERGSA